MTKAIRPDEAREALDRAPEHIFTTWLYTTRDDAVAAIAAAIEGSGVVEDAAAVYDLDAIADEVLVWDDGHDAETGATWLDRQGWLLVEGDAFWRAVERHERAEDE